MGKNIAQQIERTAHRLLDKIETYLRETGQWVDHEKECQYMWGRPCLNGCRPNQEVTK